jgi:hypothetical protein
MNQRKFFNAVINSCMYRIYKGICNFFCYEKNNYLLAF